MKPSIIRYFIGTGATVFVLTLCVGWPVYSVVAQDNDAPPDGHLTVGKCINANDASVAPIEEALIKEDIIEENLLQTKVTNSMCKDMLEETSDGTLVRRLVVAQNYMQETKFIEGAMRRAGGEVAVKGTTRRFLADKPSVLNTNLVAAVQSTAEAQYPNEPPPPPQGQSPDSGGDQGDRIEVTPETQLAAAAANAGEDSDAPIAERLDQKETAAIEAGASAPEAAAGARCSLEVDVLDDEIRRIPGMYTIKPHIPKEIHHRETGQVGLLVSPLTLEKFQKIRETHGAIAGFSESNIGCVVLTDWMSAKLIDWGELDIDPRQPDDMRELSPNRDTRWSWDIRTSQTGEHSVLLDLRYAVSREDREFRLVPGSPVYEGVINVAPPQSDSGPEPTERPWWRRIFEFIFGLFGA